MSVETEWEFEFSLETSVRFGAGRVTELGAIARSEGYSEVGLLVDEAVTDAPEIEATIASLNDAGITVHTFENDTPEPSYVYLDTFRDRIAGPTYDCLVGVGGGSTMDLAKAMAVLLRTDDNAIEYKGFPDIDIDTIPIIAVPTTAGTGSEVTFNASFFDREQDEKMGINVRQNHPEYAILDPELTVSCPPKVTASAGMDAIVHTLDSFASTDTTPYARLYLREAFDLLYNNLHTVYESPGDLKKRSRVLLGSHYAGVGMMNSGGGPISGLSYPLGEEYQVSHGIAGAVFVPAIVGYNVDSGYKEYAALYDRIDGADRSLSPQAKSEAFVTAIEDLCEALNVPRSLSALGIDSEETIYGKVTSDRLRGSVAQNPVKLPDEELRELLADMV